MIIARLFDIKCPLCGRVVLHTSPGDFPLVAARCTKCSAVVSASKSGDLLTVLTGVRRTNATARDWVLDSPKGEG